MMGTGSGFISNITRRSISRAGVHDSCRDRAEGIAMLHILCHAMLHILCQWLALSTASLQRSKD